MNRILVITGPTATGKTGLGVALAEKYGGEVVSADSMQIYRGMSIGTAKPGAEEMRGVPHHMLDVAEPFEDFSVSRYVEMATKCVDDILLRGKLPILVGGTGLYIDSLQRGIEFGGAEAGGALRSALENEYDEAGGAAMLEKLRRVDPARADKLHPADKKRIIRALEVYRLTGETITVHDERTKNRPPRYDALKIALSYTLREDLYRRIDERVDQMIARGLLDEVRGLLDAGVPETGTAMQAIGYKELLPVLRGETSLLQGQAQIKQESRRYAKRQLTWLRRETGVKWILWEGVPNFEKGLHISTEFLEEYGII